MIFYCNEGKQIGSTLYGQYFREEIEDLFLPDLKLKGVRKLGLFQKRTLLKTSLRSKRGP